MTIHVDDPMTINLRFPNYCHLWSSTNDIEELHAFAARLNLQKHWFQTTFGMTGPFYHYDISQGKRKAALELGAVYKPLKDWIRERKQAQKK